MAYLIFIWSIGWVTPEAAADVGSLLHLPEHPVQRLGTLAAILRQERAEFFRKGEVGLLQNLNTRRGGCSL